MDKDRRNNLRRVIRECRRILEEDLGRELLYYGFSADGIVGVEALGYLKDLETRRRIEAAIEKERVGGITEREAIERYIRQSALTFLNRIAALRALEVRGLIAETVIQRYGGKSFRERRISEREPGLSPYEALKKSLTEAFNEVGKDVKVLFDIDSEYSIIFPSEKACRDVIKVLCYDVTEEDWREDDIIGWVYQYFNDESREKFKKEKRKPKADDVPVINQFYTPHWIVKALVDNTLGKLWLEMHPQSRIRELCAYMIPENLGDREPKKAREIKVLDPACGSGHFLLYAFDVLYEIYREDELDTPEEEIPALILENNLYGIDIDLTSVQLASFALYMKAKTKSPTARIRAINVVCADIRITNGRRRYEFLKWYEDDPELQQIFAKLFNDLSYTYEIGSLLKVRKPFEELFEKRKGPQQTRFLAGQKTIEGQIAGQTSFKVRDLDGNVAMVVPKRRTIEEMLENLKALESSGDMGERLFVSETEKSVGLLSILSDRYDVVLMNPPYGDMPPKTKEYLRKYYPNTHFDYYAAFIEQASDLTESYVGALTGKTFMFLKRYEWVREEIFGRRMRPQMILDLGSRVLDVATANWAAFTAKKKWEGKTTFVQLTDCPDEPEKVKGWEDALGSIKERKESERVFEESLEEFKKVPGMPFCYWAPDSLKEMFEKYPPLDRDVAGEKEKEKIGDTCQGLHTADDQRFTRWWWEVEVKDIVVSREETFAKKWVPISKGGFPFYYDIPMVVNWFRNGKEIKDYITQRYPYLNGKWEWVVINEDFYFKKGIAWASIVSVNESTLEFYKLPKGTIFKAGTHALFAKELWQLLAAGNSKLLWYLFFLLNSTAHNKDNGYISKLPIHPDVLKSSRLSALAKEAYSMLREWDTGNETSTQFIMPWILQRHKGFSPQWKPVTGHPLSADFEWSSFDSAREIRGEGRNAEERTITELADMCVEDERKLRKRIDEIQKEIDDEMYRIYGISEKDRELIERGAGTTADAGEEESSEDAGEETEEEERKGILSAKDHVERLLSYYIKKSIESTEDGIITTQDLFQKVLDRISEDFGADRRDKVEGEINSILGKTLDKWIEEDYSELHVSMYRRRPVFWQLSSKAFSCFLDYHRLTRDTVPKILGIYLPPVKRPLEIRRDELRARIASTDDRKKRNDLTRELAKTEKELSELYVMEEALKTLNAPRDPSPKSTRWVENAIAEVRDRGWSPNLDYGVRVNIEPLKELKLLHPSARRVK